MSPNNKIINKIINTIDYQLRVDLAILKSRDICPDVLSLAKPYVKIGIIEINHRNNNITTMTTTVIAIESTKTVPTIQERLAYRDGLDQIINYTSKNPGTLWRQGKILCGINYGQKVIIYHYGFYFIFLLDNNRKINLDKRIGNYFSLREALAYLYQ